MTGRIRTLLVWALILGACLWQILRTPFVADLTHFLPSSPSVSEHILVEQMRQGTASRLILVALAGGAETDRAEASRAFAARLASNPLFAAVHNGSAEFSDSDWQFLLRNRYLLSPSITADSFTVEALRAELEARQTTLTSASGMLEKQFLARDPIAGLMRLLESWTPRDAPAKRQGVWFNRDGGKALLILETRAAGFDLDAQTASIQALHEAFAQVRGNQPLSMVATGPPVFSVEANQMISGEAATLSSLDALSILLLLWLAYRSIRIVALGAIPLVCGALAGTAAVGWWFGSVHGITLGFGATLLGVAADYPNHLFTHRTPEETPDHAIRRIWPTLRLGVLTNVAGFTAMLFSGFEGLAQLGLFAAVGLLTAGASVRWLLPPLMPARIPIPQGLLDRFARLPHAPAHTAWIPPAAGLMAIAWLWLSPQPIWNDSITAMNPIPESSKRLDESLRDELGAPDLRKLLVVRAETDEEVLTISERLVGLLDPVTADGSIQGYEMAATYLPSRDRQHQRQQWIPPAPELRERLAAAQEGLAFRSGAFDPFLEDAEEARRQSLLAIEGPLPGLFKSRVASLLFEMDGGWVGLVPLRGVVDEARLREKIAGLDVNQVSYLDLTSEANRLLTRYRGEALQLLGWSSLAIVLLLAVGLRSLTTSLRVLLPMICAAAVTAAVMAATAGGLSLFHLVSLLLVMGLSLDQALFFNRAMEDHEERARTLLSLALCNLSALIAFGILSTSSIKLLHDIGATVALGAALALLFAAFLARKPEFDNRRSTHG